MVAVAVAKARELGFETVACASTGNLANAVAAHAAAAGLDSYVFVPSDLEEQKLLATAAYGTKLVGVRGGNYDDVNRLCTQLCEDRRWAFVNVNLRPYYAEGVENARLRDGRAARLGAAGPGRRADRLRLAVHQGGTRLQRWLDAGLVEGELPAFNGAQAEGCLARGHRLRRGLGRVQAAEADTIAKSLAIGNPADGPYALELARRTGGAIDSVTDDQIRAGIRLLAETTGVFTETAGGVRSLRWPSSPSGA